MALKIYFERMSLVPVLLAFFFFFSSAFLASIYSQKKGVPKPKEVKKSKVVDFYVEIGGKKLSLSEAMKLALFNNLTLRKYMYDLLMADTELLKFQKKYALNLGLEGKYMYKKAPAFNKTFAGIQGDTTKEFDVIGSVSKKFASGTTIIAGMNNLYSDVNDKGFLSDPPNPPFFKPGFFVEVKQELLKNFIGIADRKKEKALEIRLKMNQSTLIDQLSFLLVQVLSDYWRVTITKKQLETHLLELRSTRNVRNIVVRNTRIGLSEKFDVNQYNALVAAAESKVALSRFKHREALRTLIRQVNLPIGTKVTGVTEMRKKLPKTMDIKKDLKIAFQDRVDHKNAVMEIEAAELEKSVNFSNTLPSLTANLKISTTSQSDNYATSLGQAASLDFPEISAGIKASYPLWNKEIMANARNSVLQLKKAQIALAELKQEVRDKVISSFENVKLTYNVYVKSRVVTKESRLYYSRLLRSSRQGKFNAIAVKTALDSMIDSRQRELENLVNYNISLLNYDVAKNKLFERYDIDFKELLKLMKQEEEK